MNMARLGKLKGNFIEGMMCEGGCINGAGVITTPFKAKNTFNKINLQSSKKSVMDNEKLEEYKKINLER